MKHIDTKNALTLLGQSEKLYYKLLKGFALKYANIMETFDNILMDADYDEARRLAHSIKGLCGYLGATELQEISKDLDCSFRDRTDDYEQILPKFSEEINIIMEEINELIIRYSIEEPGLVRLKKVSDKFYKIQVMKLDKAMSSFKYSATEESYRKIKLLKIPDMYKDTMPPIFKAINNFDYKLATSLIESQMGFNGNTLVSKQ
jgi:two-component system sensor histidine kinase/response regulator